jgi:hypothetical protein
VPERAAVLGREVLGAAALAARTSLAPAGCSNWEGGIEESSSSPSGSARCGGPEAEVGPHMMPRRAPGWRERQHRGGQAARWVRRGVTVDFKRNVKATARRFHQPPSWIMDQENWKERKAERDRCLAVGAFVPAPSQDVETLLANGAMISPAFLVPKKGKTNRWRMIVDMRKLNEMCRKRKIRFQGLRELRHVGRPGCWMFTWDLQAGYMNLGVYKAHQKYMTVDMGSWMAADGTPLSKENPRFVECAVMPFGYQNSPWYFVKMTKVVQGELARLGITCLMWIDDGIVVCDTKAVALEQRELLSTVLHRFGLRRAETKGQWDPVQDLEHLGVGVNSQTGHFYTTRERRAKIARMGRAIVCSAARHRRLVGARWLAEFCGLAMSTYDAVGQCRFRLREIFDCLRAAEVWRRGYGQQIKLTRSALRSVQWWIDTLGVQRQAVTPQTPIWRPAVTAVVTADASGEGPAEAPGGGWGATLGGVPLPQAAPDQDNGEFVRGIWAVDEVDMHITAKELRTIKYMLNEWRGRLRGRHVLLWEDNQAVVGILRKWSTRSVGMRSDLEDIIRILEDEAILLQVRYIRSKHNPADWWSRVVDKAEWCLHPLVADSIVHRFGPAQVDRFADSNLALLRRFNAAYPCRGAEAVDTFTVSWEHAHNWINAPFNLIGRALYKLWCEPAASAAMIVPVWPTASWWPLMLRLATEAVPLELPAWAYVPGPLMQQREGMRPEPLLNSGWKMQLILVPARTSVTASRYSASMIFGSVQAGRSRANSF